MDRLSNITIVKAEPKKSGEGKYGPWELWRISVDDADWKDQHFSYFSDKNNPTLKAGQVVDFIEFETTQDGQYTNYTIKKVGLKEEEKPKPQPQAQTSKNGGGKKWNDNPISMYFGYGRTLTETLIEKALPLVQERFKNPEYIAALVTYFGITLHKASTGDAKTLARMREVYKAGASVPPTGRSPGTDDSEKPEEEVEFDPQKWAAEEALHCAEIDNVPYLENWWKKICKSKERKLAGDDVWQGIVLAHEGRKGQLNAEYTEKKAAGGKDEGDGVHTDGEEEIPF